MKRLIALGLSALLSMPAWAEDWAKGEIRRIDAANLRLTIKHGEIKNLDMPPMTMVFYVTDASQLTGFQVQDQIEFQAVAEGKKYVVTQMRKAGP